MKRISMVVAAIIIVIVGVGIAARSSTAVPTFIVHREDLIRHVTADGTIEAEQSTPITAPIEARQPMKIGWIADDQTFVRKGDPIVRFDPTTFEAAVHNGTVAQEKATNRAAKNDADRSADARNLEGDARQAEHELQMAQSIELDDANIYSRYQRIESDIDRTYVTQKRDYSRSVRDIRDHVAGADASLIAIDRRKADLSVNEAQRALSSLIVAAPHDGVIVLRRDWRGDLPAVGSTVWSGTPLASIPKPGGMKAIVFVLEADAGGIAVGDQASITVESSPDRRLSARVMQMSRVAKPRFRDVPVQYFEVTLKITPQAGLTLKPGGSARATITLGAQKNVLAIPRQAIFNSGGQQVVYVRRRDRFLPVGVTPGSSTAGRVVVTGSLKEGDRIAMKDPR